MYVINKIVYRIKRTFSRKFQKEIANLENAALTKKLVTLNR